MSNSRQTTVLQDSGDAILLARSFAVTLPRNAAFSERIHRAWDQLAYATSGLLTITSAGSTWTVPSHRALWIPAAQAFSLRASGSAALRSVFLRPGISVALLRRENLHLPLPLDNRACRTAELILGSRGAAELPTIARNSGASIRTLGRLFAEDTGMAFGRWRRRARCLAALGLISEGADVTAAGVTVGYSTPSAFISAFKREFGLTPARLISKPQLEFPSFASD